MTKFGYVGVCSGCGNLCKTEKKCLTVTCECGTRVRMYLGVVGGLE